MRGTPGTSDSQFKKFMFLTFGAMEVTKPYKFIGLGALDALLAPY